jgi:hypothetical protein
MFQINYALVCVLALTLQAAYSASIEKRYAHGYTQQYTPQYQQQLRTLSGYGYDSSPAVSSRLQAAPSIIAAPIFESTPVVNSGYSSQQQQNIPVNSGYGQQQQTVQATAPVVQVAAPVSTVKISAPLTQSSSSYGQQVVTPVVTQSSYDSSSSGYGGQQHHTTLSPFTQFMSQPAIQQLITTMVQQYHGNQLATPQEMPNNCAVGFTQPIYESNQVTETYCRCPTGTYGFTCTENFANPCLDGSIEFTATDSRVPANYFIKCSWGIPYLHKCPAGTARWSQDLHACISDDAAPSQTVSSYGASPTITRPITQSASGYGAQVQPQVQQQLTQSGSGYGAQVQPQVQQFPVSQSQGGYGGQQTVVSQSQGSSY